jgi:long-chain acyl-CoA synthetase
VEECIAALPNVREAGVIGVPDPKTGEAVRAYVVADDPAPSEAEIIAHCREHLTAYKVPRAVEFLDDLPKSPVGKILRKDLRKDVETAATTSLATSAICLMALISCVTSCKAKVNNITEMKRRQ